MYGKEIKQPSRDNSHDAPVASYATLRTPDSARLLLSLSPVVTTDTLPMVHGIRGVGHVSRWHMSNMFLGCDPTMERISYSKMEKVELPAHSMQLETFLQRNGMCNVRDQNHVIKTITEMRAFLLNVAGVTTDINSQTVDVYSRGSNIVRGFFTLDPKILELQSKIREYLSRSNIQFLSGPNIDIYFELDVIHFYEYKSAIIDHLDKNDFNYIDLTQKGVLIIKTLDTFPNVNLVIRHCSQTKRVDELRTTILTTWSPKNARNRYTARTAPNAPILFSPEGPKISLLNSDATAILQPEKIFNINNELDPIYHTITSIARIVRANACYPAPDQNTLVFNPEYIKIDQHEKLDEAAANFLVALLSNAEFTWLSLHPIAQQLSLRWITLLDQEVCQKIDNFGLNIYQKIDLLVSTLSEKSRNDSPTARQSLEHEIIELLSK